MIVITTTGRRLSGPGSNAPDSVPCRRLGRDLRSPESGSAVEAGRLATFDVDLRVDACQLDPHHERVIVLYLSIGSCRRA
jgi:hypothetical protein